MSSFTIFFKETIVKEMMNVPPKAINIVMSLPIQVKGKMSPKPTVAIVMTVKYIALRKVNSCLPSKF